MLPRKLNAIAILVGVFLLSGACAIVDHVSEDGVEGYLSFGFEESAFRPCGIDEQWWVEESSRSIELFETYRDVVGSSQDYVRVYARLIGSRSESGRHGHLGAYDRIFTVSRIVDMRRVQDGDCSWPGDDG
jgi:hypothetical protein